MNKIKSKKPKQNNKIAEIKVESVSVAETLPEAAEVSEQAEPEAAEVSEQAEPEAASEAESDPTNEAA